VDILSQFPAQYALAAFCLLIICLWKKVMPYAVASGLIIVLNIAPVIDIDKSIQATGNHNNLFSIYSANIQRFNKDLSVLKSELMRINPDIILLMEVTPERVKDQLQPLIDKSPYSIVTTPMGEHCVGMVFLSKFPIVRHKVKELTKYGNSLLGATLTIDRKDITFYAIHPQNPLFRSDFDDRQAQLLSLASSIRENPHPVIVAGDFNATPYSPVFRKLLSISGLRDSRNGFGWQPSWPTYMPLAWIPIDHVLVSHDFQVLDRSTGAYIGSDHYPLYAQLAMN